MAKQEHPAWREESKRLDYTKKILEETLIHLAERQEQTDREVEWGRKHSAGVDSAGYDNLLISLRLQGWLAQKRRSLLAARQNPYFVRVDFWEDGRSTPEQLYIGKTSLTREGTQELVIVDWRAPVSTLYYEGRLGRAAYRCPEGEIKGELLLKRQLAVTAGELTDVLDIDITTSDEFLQPYLQASADKRLKDIVATIQAEQNRIIRAEMWKPLVVQGAAGSGKTTIALHRIAYLIYTFEKTLQPENFLIIAPSRLFLNYISAVLPELGVEQVRQTTFADLARLWLGFDFNLRDPNERLVRLLQGEGEQSLLWREAEFKSSLAWKEIMEAYFHQLEEELRPKGDFTLGAETILPTAEIRALWGTEYAALPLRKRAERLRILLENRLDRSRELQAAKLQDRCNRQVEAIKQARPDTPARRELVVALIDQKNAAVEAIHTAAAQAVDAYLAGFELHSVLEYYHQLFCRPDRFDRLVGKWAEPELRRFIREQALSVLAAGEVETEDLAPLLYLQHRLWGIEEEVSVRHTVVDEAQDLSVYQIDVLRAILKDSSFTLLGDLSQGIHAYRGVRSWPEVLSEVFRGSAAFQTLELSYRTTVEIMHVAQRVLAALPEAKEYPSRPVIRHGEPVGLHRRAGSDRADDLIDAVRRLRAAGGGAVAVIGKAMAECRALSAWFNAAGEAHQLLTGREDEYRGGLVIAPAYLVKGLEFDAVLLADVSPGQYQNTPTDIRLLYVAMTRAMHLLEIYYLGEPSPLLHGINK